MNPARSRSVAFVGEEVPSRDRCLCIAVSLTLALVVWAVFGQTLGHEFVNYDDDAYVYDNPHVNQGLTSKAITAAFTGTDIHLWTPLTRISHMVDYQFFGLQPWGHHLSNVLLHSVSTIVLFFALRQMTGALWRSAFVATVFAIHPLHVESVAWVSERKDTLSGLFFMLTLLAYVGYARQPSSHLRYWGVIVLFALGLLAKPMLVTLPFVLLLLDYWPLKRTAGFSLRLSDWRPLVAEKIPLFALTGGLLWLVLFDPFDWSGPGAETLHPALSLRLSNAVVSYAVYIWQMFYPVGLSIRYPFPLDGIPMYQVAVSIILLGAMSLAAYSTRARRPYLIVGWLWYIGMLLPVSQIVQLGSEARCDRYTYLPHIGLYIAVGWGLVDCLESWRFRRIINGVAAALVLIAMIALAHAQTAHWKNSVSLWTHAVASAPADYITHNNLGFALASQDQVSEEAVKHFQEALKLHPNYPEAHNNLGLALAARGKFNEAISEYEQVLEEKNDRPIVENNLGVALAKKGDLPEAARHLQQALRINPNYAQAHDNLGLVLAAQGDLDEAIHEYQLALADKPGFAQAHNNLGVALVRQGKVSEALQRYEQALKLKPDYAAAHVNLGLLLAARGKIEEAISHYNAALKLEPGSVGPRNNLAWVLATHPAASVRDGPRAVELAEQENRLSGENDPSVLDTLAAAYAEVGDYDKAMDTATRAIELGQSANSIDLAQGIAQRREVYRRHRPYRHPE